MFQKLIRLNNNVTIKLVNINDVYWKKLKEEFYFRELKSDDKFSLSIVFKRDVDLHELSIVTHNGPIASDKFGVFFKDQDDKIARFKISENNNDIISFEIQEGFDPHFFYIIVLYCSSILFQNYGGAFVHAACLRKKQDYILLPAWRHAGKTHLALSFMADGYDLVTDDGAWINSSGKIYPLSRNIHILYHNIKINSDLVTLIDCDQIETFDFISNIEKSDLLISKEHLRYLRSKFRVRIPIKKIWDGHELSLSKDSKVILLNRSQGPTKSFGYKKIEKKELVNMMFSSSKFELSFMFDLYNIFKSRFGVKIELFESYDNNFISNINAGFQCIPDFYRYDFPKYPMINEIK